MKWIYHAARADNQTDKAGVELVYLRPVWTEDHQEFTSGVIELRITSMEYINKLSEEGEFSEEETRFLNPIRDEVMQKDYYIDEIQPEEDERNHYLHKADLYVAENFDMQRLLQWVQLYLSLQGYPFTTFEATDFEKFANDVNPILRIFSPDTVKKYESSFGPEWWKSTHKKKPDKKAIESLLKLIHRN